MSDAQNKNGSAGSAAAAGSAGGAGGGASARSGPTAGSTAAGAVGVANASGVASAPSAASDTALSPLKRAFIALEQAQAKVAALEGAAREPIAIVGLGCRVPGGGNDASSFWRLMRDGVDAISRVPSDRWDIEALYDADTQATGKIATREGGFLGPVDSFDPSFFGIAPREAQGMDPQQRLLLEVCWEALEHAGQAPDRLERSRTGVYFGVTSSDYTYLQLKSQDSTLLDAHFTSGIAHSIFSGRLSYLLGLQGPSLTIDTACSSSLVAVHLACQALRTGECRMALAGGVNLILAPDVFIALSHSRMLAPDGRCKTFDAAADGFARGEGCGVVVLKRLADAIADGDRVLAVIRGSAVNQDGASSGLTAPNGPQQEAVIREALDRAGLAPRQVGFIEAHGTGTQLGDPLEVHALGAVFGADRAGVAPLWIGSAKTNLGHLEAAAGVTGLIKLVLSLQNKTIPAHLHFQTPSPHIHWADYPLRVPTSAASWDPIDGRRIGGVSSFGFSGTNVHIIVEEAPVRAAAARSATAAALNVAAAPVPAVAALNAATAPATAAAAGSAVAAAPAAASPAGARQSRAHLFTISARDRKALAELAHRYVDALEDRRDEDLADICRTANAGRAHFSERAAVVVRSVADLRTALAGLANGETARADSAAHALQSSVRVSSVLRGEPPRVAFLFTGQGAQYANMARGLYADWPVFRTALDECARILDAHLERPLLSVLFTDDGASPALDETAYTQPALFAVEYALTQLWRCWGITPNIVMGHSVGEIVAACVAGVFSLEDALLLIANRGRLLQSLPSGGAMAAISAAESHVAELVGPYRRTVAIAAVNGPAQTVVSGAAADVASLCERLVAAGTRCKPLTVSHAFHSPLVEPILDKFEREIAAARLSAPRLRLISNLTGAVADGREVTQPVYWRRHVREAVRFGDGLRTLKGLKPDCIVEIGPHPTLVSFASATYGDEGPARIASLRKGTPDTEQVLDALASLYLLGAQVEWRATEDGDARVVDLPTYPFQRERCWFASTATRRPAAASGRATGHTLLGNRLRTAGKQALFESTVSADAPAFIREHRVQGHVIVPATAYLDTLLACARRMLKQDAVSVEGVTVSEAMVLADDGAPRLLQTICEASSQGAITASISSAADEGNEEGEWTTHVTATLRATGRNGQRPITDLRALRQTCPRTIAPSEFYAAFTTRGLDFGPGFRAVRELYAGDSQALGLIELAAELSADRSSYEIHPVLLDGCLQVLAAALPTDDGQTLYLPIGIGRFASFRQAPLRCWSHVIVEAGTGETRRATVNIFDEQGEPVAELADVQLKRVARDALGRLGERWLDDSLYEVRWVKSASASSSHVWSPAALVDAAAPSVSGLKETAGVVAYDTFLNQLEALCVDYSLRALERLGWKPTVGEVVQAEPLAERLRVVPAHRRLFARLLAILGEAGWLAPAAAKGSWKVQRTWSGIDVTASVDRLRRNCPKGADAELELTVRVASELAEALRGEREPMQLLFPGGSLDTAERIYRDSPTARFYNGLMTELVSAVSRASAQGRKLRILEIGGGTGGTTAHVLPRLPAQDVEYTFTDVGPLFVARARERFGSFGFARFEVLDLERDPASQGFTPGQYDLVIASNVIHATADLRRTLTFVRSLLAEGGLLAMLEVTAPQRWFDLTVGLTTGWWAFTDLDLRPDYATLTRARWLSLLAEMDFDETAALPAGTALQGCLSLQSLLLARAGRAKGTWLMFADEGGTVESVASSLRTAGAECVLVRSRDVKSPADYKRLLADATSSGRTISGVVHAWSLDDTAWDSSNRTEQGSALNRGVLSAMYLAQAVVGERSPPPLWIVTRGGQPADARDRNLAPSQATSWGLGKALALEHPELHCVCVDLDDARGPSDAQALLSELSESARERQVAYRGGERRVARLSRYRRPPSARSSSNVPESWRLVPQTTGSLDGFRLDTRARRAPSAGEVEIAVDVTSLNFKDVLNALGMYPGDPGPLGGECAGRVVSVGSGVTHVRPGSRVMAVAGGSFASHVLARAELVQPIPDGVSDEDAAAFSIAYLTAEFCLGHLAQMRAGDRVLIHAAAGGVGMAAVRLAQRAGAEVFATAGSPWKRDLLRSWGVEHVFDSRTPAFSAEILAKTGGRGVDIVLNSLAGDLIEPSFTALARGGRFVEIGKRGIKDAAWVAAQKKDWRYFIVDWGDTAGREPELIGGMYTRLVADLRAGHLAPLPRHVFTLDDVAQAFRFMAQARHAGKIVVRHAAQTPLAVSRNGTYLITGGLSGLGLRVARWLAEEGAGRLALVGRRGVTPEAESVLEEIRATGTQLITEALDICDETAVKALLARVRASGPPLRGVVHSAGALDDAGILQQDARRYGTVFAAKVTGASLLDSLTRGDVLDFFVLFASVAGVLGSSGQSNHSAANAFLDVLAHERRHRGLPALSIDWGAWTQIGAAADRGIVDRLAAQGIGAITPTQGLVALRRLMEANATQAAVLPIDWQRYLQKADQNAIPAFLSDVAGAADRAETVAAASTSQTVDLKAQLAEAPLSRRAPLMTAFVREHALRALGVDPAKPIDPRTPLGDLGLDSLLAVELRNTLGRALGASLPATLLFDYPSIESLAAYLLNEVLQLAQPEAPATTVMAEPAAESLVGSIESMSDDEVDRLIAARSQRKA